MLQAVVGINWGDEGKGRMVDLLCKGFDAVVRYQGGNNAGHTVLNDKGKFVLNLLPSGIFDDNTINVMGNGMVIDIEHLVNEIERLKSQGIVITPDKLKISDKAVICMPYHKLLDCLEEDRLKGEKFGSTRRGIAPVYSDKYMKKGVRMGDLLHLSTIKTRLEKLVEWKNLLVTAYGADKIDSEEIYAWLIKYGTPLIPYITDTTELLSDMAEQGKNILFEAQLGTLRDIDFGIYPFTTSSSTIAAYAPIGSGVPQCRLDKITGIVKAYSSCVGEGPFTCELKNDEGDALREAGQEYGAATGRPRRVGGFDVVATRYGVKMQGADELALTKLDVMSYMDRIPVCVAYEVNGVRTDKFPIGEELNAAKPIYEYMEGFKCDISKIRCFEDLPTAAKAYILYIEKEVGCPIRYISVGADREAYIERRV